MTLRHYMPRLNVLSIGMVLLVMYILQAGIGEFLVRSDSAHTGIRNTLCASHRDQPGVEDLCNKSAPFQYNKFVFVMTDAFPRAFSDDIINNYRDHSVVYNTLIDGVKLSHAIMLSHFSGQPDTKFWASRTMERDTVFDSWFRAGMKVSSSHS